MTDENERETTTDRFGDFLREAAKVTDAVWDPRALLPPGTKLAGGRIEILRRIGEGGTGVVYEAFDAERRGKVALKTLSLLDADGIYGLKNEFRALADVRHEGLVALHDLFRDGERWFFTMELIDGEPFDLWVRPNGALDETRLRSALVQLVDGICAIHAAGKLHRDLKPTNVLVDRAGRVRILDFGLAVEPELGGVGQTVRDNLVSGTPAYMAPEQAAGEHATGASDMYALGVMLFEALTGRLPFEGRTGEILAAKQRDAAPRARAFAAGAPADLDALCVALLAREPAERPDTLALRAQLGGAATESRTTEPAVPPPERELLLGRDAELAQLRHAYEATLGGAPVVLFVSGESGMGKSTLVSRFLDELGTEGHAAVLAGRCHERESVSFKGFDALVDDLSRFLRRHSHVEAASLMPREVFALARLFPVLDRVEVVAQAPRKDIPDPQELRRRAFAAFAELMARIRDRQPLVLYIDDTQWLDRDAEAFLRTLLVDREPSALLLVLAHRSENLAHNAALQAVRAAARENPRLDERELPVGPLAPDAAEALAGRWFGAGDASLARRAAREAGGSPFFVAALARYAARWQGEKSLSHVSLERALADHLEGLAPSNRRLLEVLAVIGTPLPMQVAVQAAGASYEDLDALRAAHLVRVSGEDLAAVECYHDRLREAVATRIGEAASIACHATLARVLQARSEADPELLARCLEGAGLGARAAVHAERAGDRAAAATAFERAAALYDKALTLGQQAPEARHALSIKLADALANAGSGPHAAAVYQGAAVEAEGTESIDLRRKAAEQLLQCGHVTEGEALLREVCDEAGVTIPKSSRRALWSMVGSQLKLRLTRIDPSARASHRVSPDARLRLDCMRSAGVGLVGHAPLVASSVVDRWLLDALRAGDSDDVAQASASQAYFCSLAFPTAERRLAALRRAAEGAVNERTAPEVRGFVASCLAHAEHNLGRWARSRAAGARALTVLREECTGVSWDIDAALIYDQVSLFHLGEFATIAHATPPIIEEAFRRGRVWLGVLLSGGTGLMGPLSQDDVNGAQRQLDAAKKRWVPQAEMQWADLFLALGNAWLQLYRGDSAAPHAELAARAPVFRRSLVSRAAVQRVLFLSALGAGALAALRIEPHDREARNMARRCARALRRERIPHGPAVGRALDAGLARAGGQPEHAARALHASIDGFERCDMAAHAAAARRRLGALLGGDEGQQLIATGDTALRARGVKNLDAMTAVLLPG